MPIVNIRDNNGNIVDTVDIPVSGGGSGGNYAPANAIVDQSPLDEWYSGRENYESFATSWEWRKHIDGTFYLCIYGCFSEDIDRFPLTMYEALPFDVFQLDEISYFFELYDDNDEFIDLDGDRLLADFYIEQFYEEDAGSNTLVCESNATDDLREYMTERGLTYVTVYADITITGKWRKD